MPHNGQARADYTKASSFLTWVRPMLIRGKRWQSSVSDCTDSASYAARVNADLLGVRNAINGAKGEALLAEVKP